MKQHNNVDVAHRCPQSSTPEQQPINIIGDINIVEATQHSNHIAITKVEWTRSHPERRLSNRSLWSYNDKGIHIADAAADHPDAPLSEVLVSAPSPIKVTII
jgi:hypothetical protein